MTERLVLSVAEAAEALGVSDDLVYELTERGELPCLRFGRRKVIPRRAIELLVESAVADYDPDAVLRNIHRRTNLDNDGPTAATESSPLADGRADASPSSADAPVSVTSDRPVRRRRRTGKVGGHPVEAHGDGVVAFRLFGCDDDIHRRRTDLPPGPGIEGQLLASGPSDPALPRVSAPWSGGDVGRPAGSGTASTLLLLVLLLDSGSSEREERTGAEAVGR